MIFQRILIFIGLGFMSFMAAAEGAFDQGSPTRLKTNLGSGCHIGMSLPFSAQGGLGGDSELGSGGFEINPLPKPWRFKSFTSLYFNLRCFDGDVSNAVIDEASFDQKTGAWVKDIDKLVRALGYDASSEEYKRLYLDFEKSIRVYNLNAINSKGVANTESETTGDDRKRRRLMGFCLFHPPKALCGSGTVGMVADGPRSDLSMKVLEILRTVEFLPD